MDFAGVKGQKWFADASEVIFEFLSDRRTIALLLLTIRFNLKT